MTVDCSRAVPVKRTSATGGGRYRMLALGVPFSYPVNRTRDRRPIKGWLDLSG